MSDFEPRRCQQQFYGTLFSAAIVCLVLCACDDGTVRPLVRPDGSIDGGGNPLDSETAGRSAAGRDASAGDDDDVVAETSECAKLRSTWPARFATDEMKLLEQINAMRSASTPTTLCAPPFTPLQPLESDPRFQCTARLRLPQDSSVKGPNARPSIMEAYDLEREQKAPEPNGLRDRQRRAGVRDGRVVAEFVIYNVGSVDGIIEALKEDSDHVTAFCSVAMSPFLSVVGAARYANVWVLDFGQLFGPPGGHPSSAGTGNSGPGTSGTGGR